MVSIIKIAFRILFKYKILEAYFIKRMEHSLNSRFHSDDDNDDDDDNDELFWQNR